MGKYLLIESRDPFTTNDGRSFYDLAASLARAENDVTLLLVKEGVLPARAGEHTFWFMRLANAGVEVLADRRSLQAHQIVDARLTPGVRPAPVELVIDRLREGRQALWH